MKVEPYLNFDGCCEEAIEFYRGALGAEVEMLMRYKESPVAADPAMVPPGTGDKVMHASLRIGETRLLASDGGCKGNANFQGISLALSAADDGAAQRLFAALADGGRVQMPLTKTFFSSSFGMVADRFGVAWMIIVGQ